MPSLFDEERPVLSVFELVSGIKEVLRVHYQDVWIEGELSNFKRPASGHCYFTLKDADAQVRCVLWKGYAQSVFFQPQDGMLVRIQGEVSLYERRGDLQVVARSMTLAGEGALQKAFEALKRRLAAEGLFDARHKQPLPPYPESVGLVTSGTGAALQDMLSILARRFPQARVLLCPVLVQGLGAAAQIAEAIDAFNAMPPGDPLRPAVLLVGRGGGSAEDLWAFNEEPVARALFASAIPVISAVGHETDVSIADFVADVRAATPSMAAELAVPDRREVAALVHGLHGTLHEALTRRLTDARQHILRLTGSYAFNRPRDQFDQHRRRLDELTERLHRLPPQRLADARQRLDALTAPLRLLDPLRPLRQGYALVARHGQPIATATALRPGDALTLRFHDGTAAARVEARPSTGISQEPHPPEETTRRDETYEPP